MTTATKEKTYAQMTLEAIPEILKTTSMAKLIDCGLDSLGLGDYSNFGTLVEDEEAGKKDAQYDLLQHEVEELTKGLHEAVRKDIKERLETMNVIAYMNRYNGAEKMADILIRFYLRKHFGLDV